MPLSIGSFGWSRQPERFRAYAATLPSGDDFWSLLEAKDDNGDRFCYRALTLALRLQNNTRWLSGGRLVSLDQKQVGSCVGHGEATRGSVLAALDCYYRGEPEKFVNILCPEWSYYASRVECGMIGRGDGSTGEGAAKAATKHGVLPKGKYGSVDCSEYTEARCRSWGDGKQLPAEVIAEAKPHVASQYIACDTSQKVWLAAGAALPINFCSMQGFEGKRDADGAIRPKGQWPHSMAGGTARYTTKAGRRLVLVHQSWGNDWTDGPYYLDQPWGSFYADLDVLGEMASEGDTFIDIGYAGEAWPNLPPDFTQI